MMAVSMSSIKQLMLAGLIGNKVNKKYPNFDN
ncbi:MAG: hypothetical protein QG614_185 [Patescibacteria group bacterium]|nr:hypothetical protein [Patescibacteria group bacterium]